MASFNWHTKIRSYASETQAAVTSNMFLKAPKNFTTKKKHFIKYIEDHTSEHFVELKEKNVLIEPFDPIRQKNLIDVKYPQSEPDILLDARNTVFKDTVIRLLDQKTNHAGTGRNKILSNISEKRYCTTLNQFILEYQKVNKLTIKLTINTFVKNKL